MKLSHPIPAAVVAIVATLALDGAAASAQTAPRPRRDPRPRPRRPGSFGLGLHEPQHLRQRRLAQGQPPARRPVLLGLLLDPLRGEPRQAPRRAREGRREQVCRRRQRRAEDRRLLGELHGRGGHRSRRGQADPAGARAHREDLRRPPSCRRRSRACRCWAPTPSSASPPSRTARRRPRSSPSPRRAASGFPTASTTRRPTRSRRSSRDQYEAHVARMLQLLGDDAGEGRGGREDHHGARDAARRGVDDPGRAPRSREDVQPHGRREARSAHAELVVVGVLPGRRRRARRRQRRPAEVLRGRQPGDAGDSPLELEDLPALEAPERRRAEPLEGLRRRGLRLLRKGPAGHAGERGPLEALRRRGGRRAGAGSRQVLREGVLPAGSQGAPPTRW